MSSPDHAGATGQAVPDDCNNHFSASQDAEQISLEDAIDVLANGLKMILPGDTGFLSGVKRKARKSWGFVEIRRIALSPRYMSAFH